MIDTLKEMVCIPTCYTEKLIEVRALNVTMPTTVPLAMPELSMNWAAGILPEPSGRTRSIRMPPPPAATTMPASETLVTAPGAPAASTILLSNI